MKNYPVTSLNYYNFFAEKAIFIDYSNPSFSLTLNKKFSNLTSFIFPFLARGWSSGYQRLDRNQKPRMKSLWHPGQSIWKSQGLFSTLSAVRIWFLIYVHYLWKKKENMWYFTCIRGGYREGGYQALLVCLKFIAQALTDACWCATINTYEIILLKESKLTLFSLVFFVPVLRGEGGSLCPLWSPKVFNSNDIISLEAGIVKRRY